MERTPKGREATPAERDAWLAHMRAQLAAINERHSGDEPAA